jgi:hypothetical protein
MKRLADALTNHGGYRVLLSGISDFHFAVLNFRPQIILMGKPDNAQGSWLRCISGCTIVSLNTEQGGVDADSVLFNYLEGQRPDVNTISEQAPALDAVDHHLIVDSFTKSVLSPYINSDTMHVVGYPRLMRDNFAISPNSIHSDLTIGFACGLNIFDQAYITETFECFRSRSYPPWNNVQAALADNVLEHLWINHLVTTLRETYRVIVRYRPGDGSYLHDDSGIEIDYSDSVEYLLSNIDVLIVGHSTLGVEALMAGVPAISIAGLADPSETYVGATNHWVPQLVWSPSNLEDLLDMIDRRSRGDLALCPDVDRYATEVTNTYYCGEQPDRSIERIVAVIDKCERGSGAQLDVANLLDLCDLSQLQRFLLQLPRGVPTRIPYLVAVWYSRLRRNIWPDSYLQHHMFVPK